MIASPIPAHADGLHIVTVSYNGTEDVARLGQAITFLRGSLRDEITLTLVDNGGSTIDALPEQLRDDARHLYGHGNIGYLAGLRLGYRASGDLSPDRWVLMCNADISFGSTFVERLLARSPREAGLIAPAIHDDCGVDLNPFLAERPSRAMLTRRRLIWSVPGLPAAVRVVRRTIRPTTCPTTSARSVYAPHGAAFLLGHRFREADVDLRHPLLLYGEEITLAEGCRRAGVPVTYDPELAVRHHEHGSTSLLRSREQQRLQARSVSYALETLYPEAGP